MTYEEADRLSTKFARTMVATLSEHSCSPEQNGDWQIAPPVFPADSVEGLYHASMMKSLLLLVPIEAPTSNYR